MISSGDFNGAINAAPLTLIGAGFIPPATANTFSTPSKFHLTFFFNIVGKDFKYTLIIYKENKILNKKLFFTITY